MNLFVGFKMNENFDVEFTSPDRKGQTTFSLSKGQLARMNLSVLFALRDVANLKSSVNTNLLVLDEILEALSERGVREVTEMIKQKFTDMNIFVVSQRAAEFTEHFNHTISYGLRGGFTTVL
jgi:energy-coupling factor transporter ATP-binding protein EcfA2